MSAASASAAARDAASPALATGILTALAAVKLAVHLATADGYGYFRDELYFLACGRHLDWGYVDHAPLIGLVARLALAMGGSLLALRVFPAVAGAALVWLTGAIAWRLGGGAFAQGLAGLAVMVMPIFLALHGFMSMNAFEPLFWMGGAYVLIRLLQGAPPRLWLAFGALMGLGLENKHSTLFFGFAVFVAILLTPQRRLLATRWPWLGGALALALFLPNLLWQGAHGFPTVEDLRNVARTGKNVVLGPVDFVAQQVLLVHPLQLPLWLAGLAWLFRAREGRYRLLGYTCAVFFVTLFALEAKNYYLSPIYPMLLAAGAVALETGLHRWSWSRGRRWPPALVLALLGAGGVAIAPIVVPLLPPEKVGPYSSAIGITPPRTEVGHRGALPQHFGDRFGWEELVQEVARIHRALPPHERARAAIFANNYGEAGAIDLFGPRYGLPAAISGHQTYWFWGPRDATGEVTIVLQDDLEDLEPICASVEEAGRHDHPWGMAEENGPIFVCRGLKVPFAELWPRVKHWN